MRNAKITISRLQLGQTQQKTRQRSKISQTMQECEKNSFKKEIKNIYVCTCKGIFD